MKTTNCLNLFLIIITLILFSKTTKSQSIHLPMENARWLYNVFGDNGEQFPDLIIDTGALIEINNKTYTTCEEGFYYREEDGIVYVIPPGETEEYLIYNFNLNLGDTYTVEWVSDFSGIDYPFEVTVNDVENVTTFDGIERKVMQVSNDSLGAYLLMMEGIGPFNSLFYNPRYVKSLSGSYTMRYHCQDGNLSYVLFIEYDCGLNAIANLENKQKVIIAPNPATSTFDISADLPLQKVQIYNAQGQLVFSNNLMTTTYNYKIEDQLPKGFYIVEIILQDKRSFVQKIIIQ